jgi:hypothetical protein
MGSDQIKAIDQRLRELSSELMRIEDEMDDLEIAKKVLMDLAGKEVAAQAKLGVVTPRPKDIPTNFEMVELVLSNAEREGRDGLTSKELLDAIRVRYWPGLKSGQIMPIIYTFVKKGRLRKTGNKFKRLKR